MADDYYKILEISRDASPEEIQKAYRRLARKFHPDLHEDEKEKEKAKQKFQKVQAAYDVLSEPEKRTMYDRFGENYQSMPGGGFHSGRGGGGAGESPFGGNEIDLSQLFGGGQGGTLEQFFRQFGGQAGGQTRRGRQPPQPPLQLDIEEEITIPFSVSVSGGEHRLVLSRQGKSETISVKIPRGLEQGKKIRLRRQGQIGPNGQQGDLLVTIHVAPHPYFHRSANNLHLKLPVSIREAVLGTKVDIPTPHGTVALTIPSGTSSGRILRLKGMGVHLDDGTKGDLLIEVEIRVPENLSKEQAEPLIAALDRLPQLNPRKNLSW